MDDRFPLVIDQEIQGRGEGGKISSRIFTRVLGYAFRFLFTNEFMTAIIRR